MTTRPRTATKIKGVGQASSKAATAPKGVRGRLQLERNGVSFLAPGRLDLLEAIGTHGSITQAAKAVGLSYKAAWDAVDAMNNLACSALVTRTTGGTRGGSTRLTDYGKHVVELVRTIERDYASVLATLDDPASSLGTFGRLSRSLSLKTSARNQWIGSVEAVSRGAVRCEVKVVIADGVHIHASVSTRSADHLQLRPGKSIGALVKATSVRLQLAGVAHAAEMERNQLLGTVSQVSRGDDQLEITVLLSAERTVTAVLARADAPTKLTRGSKVCVSFSPEHVLLVDVG
jgi:molybdate transport system regulatory protein